VRIIIMPTISPTQRISPMLWFDDQAEQAAGFYTSIFKNAKILNTTRYTKEAEQAAGRPAGSVMTVEFVLDGQKFTALNGGPHFKFNEAISFVVRCSDQQEVDYYWDRLSAGGDAKAQQCGWLKDKFGLSWQVVPTIMSELLTDPNSEKSQRAFATMMQMKKIDIEALKRAYDGR